MKCAYPLDSSRAAASISFPYDDGRSDNGTDCHDTVSEGM